MPDPNKCSSLLCPNSLGPDDIEFTHGGKPAGGLCHECIDGVKKLRVVFELDASNILQATESQILK